MADPNESNREQIERDQGQAFLDAIRQMREREAKQRQALNEQLAVALADKYDDKEDRK